MASSSPGIRPPLRVLPREFPVSSSGVTERPICLLIVKGRRGGGGAEGTYCVTGELSSSLAPSAGPPSEDERPIPNPSQNKTRKKRIEAACDPILCTAIELRSPGGSGVFIPMRRVPHTVQCGYCSIALHSFICRGTCHVMSWMDR